MADYLVKTKEVHSQLIRINAKSKKDAIAKVKNGEGQMLENSLDYLYTLDTDEWEVEKE